MMTMMGAVPSDAEVVPLSSEANPDPEALALAGLTVLVAGATGGTGKEVVKQLVDLGVPVRALVRDAAKARQELPPSDSVEIVTGDVFQYDTVERAMAGCNAVVCATGNRPSPLDPAGPFNVDYQGTQNLIGAASNAGCEAFVLVSSIGADELFFPLNLFYGVLFWKKRAEEKLQRSGLRYTVVRPGGLKNELGAGEEEGAVVMGKAGTFGLPPKETPGSILRSQVASVCVKALREPDAANKVIEIVAKADQPPTTLAEAFASVL